MSDEPLTAEQEALLEEIESDEPSERAIGALEIAIERFDFTATLLASLADWLREQGDPDGADIVLECSGEMAHHEARTA
jgi:hypothetical protein